MEITFWSSINQAVTSLSFLELIAVLLGLIYLVLAAKESIWCWPAAFVSTLIYLYIFFEVSLFSETLLQVFYLIMAVLGWWRWRGTNASEPKNIRLFSPNEHVFWLTVGTVSTLVLGWLMQRFTQASFPYLDAFTTSFAIITTFMVINKILENWLYWLVIDGVSIYLYFQKDLQLTVLLFALYEVIVIVGYFRWKRQYVIEKQEYA